MGSATQVLSIRAPLTENAAVEMVIWRVPEPVRGSNHYFKYRLALIVDGTCVIRYDNEAGKGDHKHVGDEEFPCDFVGVDALRRDFLVEAREWLSRNGSY